MAILPRNMPAKVAKITKTYINLAIKNERKKAIFGSVYTEYCIVYRSFRKIYSPILCVQQNKIVSCRHNMSTFFCSIKSTSSLPLPVIVLIF